MQDGRVFKTDRDLHEQVNLSARKCGLSRDRIVDGVKAPDPVAGLPGGPVIGYEARMVLKWTGAYRQKRNLRREMCRTESEPGI